MGTTAQLGHPLFGPKVAKLYVYRWAWHEPSKSERKVVVVARLDPSTIKDEEDLRERWGPGRYRVEGRDANGRVIGNAWDVDIPDENGVVPVGRPNEKPAPAPEPEGDDTVATVLEIQRQAREAALSGVSEQLAALREMHREQLAAVRADRSADMQLFSTLLGAKSSAPAGDAGFMTFLQNRVQFLEKELSEVRGRASETALKLAKNDAKRGDVMAEAVSKGVDGFFDLVKAGAMERAEQRRQREEREAREAREGERVEQRDGAARELESGRDDSGYSLPSVEEVAAHLRAGGAIRAGTLRQFAAMRARGGFPDALWDLVGPLVETMREAEQAEREAERGSQSEATVNATTGVLVGSASSG
jgi:hypothetical protein